MRPQDMPAVRAIVARRGAGSLPVLVARPRRREDAAVPDADEGVAGATDVHHQEAPLPPHVPARRRRVGGACRSSTRWCRRRRRCATPPRRRRRASPASTCRTARRWTSGRRRRRAPASTFTEILKPLEPFRDRDQRRQRPGASVRRRRRRRRRLGRRQPHARGGGVPHRRGARARRPGAPRRVGRSGGGAAHRSGHAAAVAGAVDRGSRCSRAKRPSAAPIATRSRGSRRRSRCRCRTTRGWCSRSCSATAVTGAERRARRQESRSLLDSVMGQVASLQKRPAARRSPPARRSTSTTCARSSAAFSAPRRRLREDVDAARRAGRRARRRSQEHLKLLMDLQVIAFQSDITRVSTLMFARELSGAAYPGDDHPRSVPQPVAPLERPRQHGPLRAAEHLPHDEVRLLRREAEGARRTATARCSITRWCSTAAR